MDIKRFAILIGTLAIIIAVVMLVRYFVKGELVVTTEPSQAQITIGEKTYVSPATIKLPQGNYTVTASKEGFIDSEKTVTIKGKKQTKVKFTLVSVDYVEGTKAERLVAVHNLPVETDHYIISWDDSSLSILIQPKIRQDRIAQDWSTYQAYGREALQWLESNGLGSKVRTENGIEVQWWEKDSWPTNAKTPSL